MFSRSGPFFLRKCPFPKQSYPKTMGLGAPYEAALHRSEQGTLLLLGKWDFGYANNY